MNTLKRHLLTAYFLLAFHIVFSQEQTIQAIRHRSDSLMQLLKVADTKERQADLVIQFYLTSIDGFPLLLLELGQQLLQLGREKKDPLIEAAAWSALGQGYRLTGNYARALEMHQKAVALAQQSGSNQMIGFAYNQMGHIYKDRLENEQALKLYHTARFYGIKVGESSLWFPMMNLGAVHLAMGQLDSALDYTNQAMKTTIPLRTETNRVVTEAVIGSIYSRKGEIHLAREHFNESLVRAVAVQSPRYLNNSYVAIAEHYNRMGLPDSAAYFNRLATEAVQNTALNNLALRPARMLIDYYQNKNADSAVKYWKIYAAANDSLNSTRANQQIQMLTLEAQQRQWDIDQASKDARTKWQTLMLIGGLLSTILILTLMARANRRRKKDHENLSRAYSELRSTQQQLIQSEKMASLGELTAGIAHEIQNPLNFVNNFSMLNTELAAEGLEAIHAGSLGDAEEVLATIADNEQKILHHGKRADAIVKGMLQHSQKGSGVKLSTNINALTDEYLRLAYHGLKAKDKSFNATIKTDFDPSIGSINIIPQDIGRVLLNLINNAFYAVDEKKKQLGDGYEPEVTVITKLGNNHKN
ncbi:MAG TPA: hypothetical protein VLA58_02065, partial [Chitinophagaceae bacterium]|nr:hypothetical protein [Chitinophagaceae bacterium]